MWYNLNIILKGMPALVILFFICTTILLVLSCTKGKRLNKELLECLACKDEVLEEFKKIRHEYNNMLQTLTCLIEEEDFEGLNEYKSKFLQKTQLLNTNNLTQLVKIKDRSVLAIIYKLFVRAKETGVVLNLTIYNDIAEISPNKSELYYLLHNNLNHAYEAAAKDSVKINLRISTNDMGFSFCFECSYNGNAEVLTLKPNKHERYHKTGKNVFFNTFIQKDKLIQEIIVPFNL